MKDWGYASPGKAKDETAQSAGQQPAQPPIQTYAQPAYTSMGTPPEMQAQSGQSVIRLLIIVKWFLWLTPVLCQVIAVKGRCELKTLSVINERAIAFRTFS